MVNGSLLGGGAEHVIAGLAGHLRRLGHHVSIATLSTGGEVLERLRADGFHIVAGLSRSGPNGMLALPARVRQVVREEHIDIVHTHDLRSLVDMGLSRRVTSCFRHVHTFHFGNYPHLPGKYLALERLFARAADRLVAVGYAQRESLAKALGLRRDRVDVVWNGVDAPVAPAHPRRWSARPGVPVIGSISAFFPQKDLVTLLEAARLVHDRGIAFHLVLVGDGPLRTDLEATVRRLGLVEVVEFAGWIPDAASTVLPHIDLFVQSSRWEAMSMVILEAMAAARPIVATAVGDNERVLKHEETGLVVPPGDPQALSAALGRLLDEPVLRHRLGVAARQSFESEFTAAAMSERYVATYRQVMACN